MAAAAEGIKTRYVIFGEPDPDGGPALQRWSATQPAGWLFEAAQTVHGFSASCTLTWLTSIRRGHIVHPIILINLKEKDLESSLQKAAKLAGPFAEAYSYTGHFRGVYFQPYGVSKLTSEQSKAIDKMIRGLQGEGTSLSITELRVRPSLTWDAMLEVEKRIENCAQGKAVGVAHAAYMAAQAAKTSVRPAQSEAPRTSSEASISSISAVGGGGSGSSGGSRSPSPVAEVARKETVIYIDLSQEPAAMQVQFKKAADLALGGRTDALYFQFYGSGASSTQLTAMARVYEILAAAQERGAKAQIYLLPNLESRDDEMTKAVKKSVEPLKCTSGEAREFERHFKTEAAKMHQQSRESLVFAPSTFNASHPVTTCSAWRRGEKIHPYSIGDAEL